MKTCHLGVRFWASCGYVINSVQRSGGNHVSLPRRSNGRRWKYVRFFRFDDNGPRRCPRDNTKWSPSSRRQERIVSTVWRPRLLHVLYALCTNQKPRKSRTISLRGQHARSNTRRVNAYDERGRENFGPGRVILQGRLNGWRNACHAVKQPVRAVFTLRPMYV